MAKLDRVAAQPTPSVAKLKAANSDPDAHLVTTPRPDSILNESVLEMIKTSSVTSPWEQFTGLLGYRDFYKEPKLTGNEAPGTLLKVQKFPMQFATTFVAGTKPGAIDAYMTMYVTERLDGSKNVSTGVIMIPRDGIKNSERKLIAYQEANDSLGARCHPSTQWSGGVFSEASAWSALGPLAQMFGKGYGVVITDIGNSGNPGPNGVSEVFAGRVAGMALLNGLRAAYQVKSLGLNPKQPVGFFGIAGGGNGAGYAAEYQPWYYPELNVGAVVLQNFNADQKQFVNFSNGSMASAFGFATIVGLNESYSSMNLDKHLNELGRAQAAAWKTMCQTYGYFVFGFERFEPLFKGNQNPAEIKDFQYAYADNIMGTDKYGPQAPTLITSCGEDGSFMSVTPAADMRKLVQRYRDLGTKVTYVPAKCDDTELITNTYRWTTDLFGMQTIDWIDAKLKKASS
ncbi:lipase family protein [Gordonia paraffinivorans]|uniref:lipase family protein n=1 Tax=Gordonia paraffinivorans TaxID=175628 RepID=UPI0013EF9E25|nr:lipase family protein [Gordonia paraffinivorans]MCD2145715.1 lipase family protein [Gordonia paraffinivorans]